METYDGYDDNLTRQESQLGFIKALVINPNAHSYGHGSIVPAVIYPLSANERIIKLKDPAANIVYAHQVFGTMFGGSPKWLPINAGVTSADEAIAAAKGDRAEQVDIKAHQPRLPLRCPKCQHEFEVSSGHLTFSGSTKCPACDHEDVTQNFTAYNA